MFSLVVGGPVLPIDLSHPTVDSQVATGTLHGYFEVYGSNVGAFTTTFEIASDDHSPALVTADVAALPVGGDRAIFSRTLNVEALPPGMYALRAIVRRNDQVQRTLTRAFEVIRPLAPATALANTTAVAAPRSLPVDPARLARPFNRGQLLDPSTLQTFRDLVGPTTRATFDQGVTQYQSGKYEEAAANFKRAVRPDGDPTAPMAYLAAVYAVQGQDAEAPTSGAPRFWPGATCRRSISGLRMPWCVAKRSSKRNRCLRMPSSDGRRTGASSGCWRFCMECQVAGRRQRTFWPGDCE